MSTTNQQASHPIPELTIETIVNFFTRLFREYKAARELRDLGSQEVSAIAREFGVTQDQLIHLAGHEPGEMKRLKAMFSNLKIDDRKLQETNASLLRDMQLVCTFCPTKRRCRRELSAGTAGENFRAYCPNSVNFDVV